MAFQPVQYKNEELVRKKLNPEVRALRWTLRQECIDQVRRNLLTWARDGGNDTRLLHQLAQCPSALLEDVLLSIQHDESSSVPLRKVIEHVLINGLEEFDFRYVDDLPITELEEVFQLLALTGRKLKRIRFVGRWIYSKQADDIICDILSRSPNLEECALQEGSTEVLVCLARNCKKLRKLEILHPSLNGKDISALRSILLKEKTSLRTSLQSLTLPSSVNGDALMQMLELYPNVTELTCCNVESLFQLASIHGNTAVVKRLAKIRSLHVTAVMGWTSMQDLTQCFPHLESLSLKTQEIMSLQELVKLNNLRRLKLENSQIMPSSYTEDVMPLLRDIGKNLTHLSLIYFDVIELAKTHSYCPNLVSLELQHFTLLGCNVDPLHRLQHGREKAFEKLNYLKMRPSQGKCIAQEAVHLLLRHCTRLRYMEMYEAFGITDAMANVLASDNGFCELAWIRLRGGHALSRNGIETLLRRAVNLRFCHIP